MVKILRDINNNVLPIDILIYSAPKTGGNTLEASLNNKDFKVYYTHNKDFFVINNDICQSNDISLENYIKTQISFRVNGIYNKKFYIFCSYRELLDRHISMFFQNYEIYKNTYNLHNLNIQELICFFNNNILSFTEKEIPFLELFNIDLNKFNKVENYYIYSLNTYCDIVIFKFNNINNWNKSLKYLLNNDFTLINGNYSKNKSYYSLMKDFINNYYINDYIYYNLKNDNLLSIFLNEYEKLQYLNRLNGKNTNDKTLIGKKQILFLQNDTNNSLINYSINSNIFDNYLKKYTNIINSLSDNKKKYLDKIYTFIFPDKSYIYYKYLPKYIKLNEKYSKNFINENHNMYYNIELYNENDYYKRDTHINILGLSKFFKDMCNVLNIKLTNEIENLLKVKQIDNYLYGFGDLLWENNLSNEKKRMITNIQKDNDYNYDWVNTEKFYCNNINNFTNKYKTIKLKFINKKNNDEIYLNNNEFIDWNIISNNIIISNNTNNLNTNTNNTNINTILVFYDSFSTHLIPIFMNVFKNCIFIKTTICEQYLNAYYYDICLNLTNLRFLIQQI
jgi:hypothetical protein